MSLNNSLWMLASLASLTTVLGLSACQNASDAEMAAWQSLAEDALVAGMDEPAKTEIYELWADDRYLPEPGEVRGNGDTIGDEIARSRSVLSWQAMQASPNTYPSFQPQRFAQKISRAALDLALRGYQYDIPEALPVAPVALASVPSQDTHQDAYGGPEKPLALAGVPVATLQALEQGYRNDQGPDPIACGSWGGSSSTIAALIRWCRPALAAPASISIFQGNEASS